MCNPEDLRVIGALIVIGIIVVGFIYSGASQIAMFVLGWIVCILFNDFVKEQQILKRKREAKNA